ncbi:uncharacterized protein [Diadema antillarum]|uniref:uncharacterized protein n=1 Tax=Diadema antillarum TaxID=105358 RepID=UPI003A8A12C9
MNFGRIGEYNPGTEDFSTYIERFEQFMVANDVQEGKKVAVFLSVIGAKTYALLKSLVSPDLPAQKKYSALNSALTTHLSPQPLVIAERFKFHQRNQHSHESVSEYAADLRRLSDTSCKFDAFLKEALRDKFVCGLQSTVIQKRLLSEANLTFDKALDLALAMELADRNTREMKGEAVGESEVKKVSGGYTLDSIRKDHQRRESSSQTSQIQGREESVSDVEKVFTIQQCVDTSRTSATIVEK